jgi:hypothetical protein
VLYLRLTIRLLHYVRMNVYGHLEENAKRFDKAGSVIETHEHAGEFKGWCVSHFCPKTEITRHYRYAIRFYFQPQSFSC